MKHLSTLLKTLTCCILPQMAGAQSTIKIENIPVVGDSAHVKVCAENIDVAALKASAGTMKMWDFSGLTARNDIKFKFLNPAGSFWENDYPGSNILGLSDENAHSYYKLGANSLSIVGQALPLPGTPPDTAKLNYNNEELIIDLPFTYMDADRDSFEGTGTVKGFGIKFTGFVDIKADGYGTLKTPVGTYDNVIRYAMRREQYNDFFGNITTQTKDQWIWISSDHKYWIMLQESVFDGFNTSSLVWYNQDPERIGTGAAIKKTVDNPIRVFPNPVINGQNLNFSWNAPGTAAIQIMDQTGQVVHSEIKDLQSGVNMLETGTKNFRNGIYSLIITNNQKISQSKFVILN
ncbi:MAG: T9SS type A sorting domain-containing protein [Flavobacteriales bacterium]|nr:T9SS type A sorting domain-containing protein [Flavobacteriales bacterium]